MRLPELWKSFPSFLGEITKNMKIDGRSNDLEKRIIADWKSNSPKIIFHHTVISFFREKNGKNIYICVKI